MSQRPNADVGPNRDDDIDLEKEKVVHTEQVHNGNMTAEEAAFLANFTDDQRKVVVRKVDLRLVPMLLILYLISFIDRANIGMQHASCCSCLQGLEVGLKIWDSMSTSEDRFPDLTLQHLLLDIFLTDCRQVTQRSKASCPT